MAVEGSLDLFRLPEILQMISRQRKTGILTVQGQQDIVAVSFLSGKIVAADALTHTVEEGLSQILVSEGLLSAEQFARASAEHHAAGGRLLDLLVERGYLARRQLLEALRLQTCRQLEHLLRWQQGDFKFYTGDEVSYEDGFLPISVEDLLLRTLQDWAEPAPPLAPISPTGAISPGAPMIPSGPIVPSGPASPAGRATAAAPGTPASPSSGAGVAGSTVPSGAGAGPSAPPPGPPPRLPAAPGVPSPLPGAPPPLAAIPPEPPQAPLRAVRPPQPLGGPPPRAADLFPDQPSHATAAPSALPPAAGSGTAGGGGARPVSPGSAAASAGAGTNPGLRVVPARPQDRPFMPQVPPAPAGAPTAGGQRRASGVLTAVVGDTPLPKQFRRMEVARPPDAALAERLVAWWVALALVAIVIAVVKEAPQALIAPFPWQQSERAALVQNQRESLFVKIDGAAKTFFLLEGRFPDRLSQLAREGLLAAADLRDPAGGALDYAAHEESYTLQALDRGRPLSDAGTSESIAGNFLLDPNLFATASTSSTAPIVLLD